MALEIVKALVDGGPKASEIFVVFVRQALLFCELPYPFDQIEIRAVGREEKQLNIQFGGVRLDGVAVLVTGVIHDEADGNDRMLLFDEIEQAYDCQSVDIVGSADAGELLVMAVDGTEDIVSLSAW